MYINVQRYIGNKFYSYNVNNIATHLKMYKQKKVIIDFFMFSFQNGSLCLFGIISGSEKECQRAR